jgi:hypothetical protein
MTEASASAPEIRIFDKGMRAPVVIRGERIGFGTSERDESLAWAEIEVYRLDAGGYLAHRIGRSLVYHRADTWCRTRSGGQPGDPATVDDLPDEAEPCEDCKPKDPQRLGDTEEIRYEFPRHTFDGCPTPEKLIEALTVIRGRDGSPPSIRFSYPVKTALRMAAERDEALYAVLGDEVLI